MSDTLGAAIIGASAAIAGVALTIFGALLTEGTRARREKAARLHGVRQDIYSRFLAHMRLLVDWIEEMRQYPDLAPEECDASLDANQWHKQAARFTSEINLIGSKDVVHDAYALRAGVFAWFAFRERWQETHGPTEEWLEKREGADYAAPDEGEDDERGADHDFIGESIFRLLVGREAETCVRSMRHDLGAPGSKDLPAYDFEV